MGLSIPTLIDRRSMVQRSNPCTSEHCTIVHPLGALTLVTFARVRGMRIIVILIRGYPMKLIANPA